MVHRPRRRIFRRRNSGQAQLAGFAKDFARESARFVQLASQRLHFRLGEIAHAALEKLLLFGEFDIHVALNCTAERAGRVDRCLIRTQLAVAL